MFNNWILIVLDSFCKIKVAYIKQFFCYLYIIYKHITYNVNDTIRMYKKWKIKMYNCVHSYIHFNTFFFDTITFRNRGEKNSKFERSKNMFGNIRFKT